MQVHGIDQIPHPTTAGSFIACSSSSRAARPCRHIGKHIVMVEANKESNIPALVSLPRAGAQQSLHSLTDNNIIK